MKEMRMVEVYGWGPYEAPWGWGLYEVPQGWGLYEVPGGTRVGELAEQAPILVLAWRPATLASPSRVLVATPNLLRIGQHAWVRSAKVEDED